MLKLTGLSEDAARFQARSAFTGTGFTTRESEAIMEHPVRRRIIQTLMLIGNIGAVSFISSIIASILTVQFVSDFWIVLLIVFSGVLLLFIFIKSKLIEILFGKIVEKMLKRWTKIYVNDYDSLLNLSAEYEITKFRITSESWLVNRLIKDLKLTEEGILILAVRRKDGYFIGTPKSTTVLYEGDQVIMYGRESLLRQLMVRPKGQAGDKEHEEGVKNFLRFEGKKVPEHSRKNILAPLKGLFQRKE